MTALLGRARLIASPLLGAAYVALASSAFSATWSDRTIAVLVGSTAAIATVVVVITRRLPSWAAALAAVAGLLGAGPLLVAGATGTGPDWAGFIQGCIDGWRAALQTTVPAPETPVLLAVPLLATWTAAAITARLVIASRASASALLPGAVALVLAGLYAPAGPPLDLRVGATGLVAAVFLAARTDASFTAVRAGFANDAPGPAGAGGLRTSTVAGVLVVGMLAGGLVAGAERAPLAELREPTTLRDAVRPPVLDGALISPLADLRRLQQREPSTTQLRVSADGELPTRLRLVALDRYDGTTWTASALFRPAGTVLPPADELTVATRRLVVTLDYEALSSPLIPTAGHPVSTEVVDADGRPLELRYDFDSQTLLVDGTGVPSRATQTALVTDGQAEDYLGAAASGDPSLLPFVEVPVPGDEPGRVALDALTDLARRTTEGAVSPFAQATLLQQAFDDRFEVAPEGDASLVYGGHGFYLIDELLGEDGGRVQAPDQLAGAYALAVRTLRLPSRVAVGFRLPAGVTTADVTGADASAWPEVYFEGLGWVPFDLATTESEESEPEEDPFDEAQDVGEVRVEDGGAAPDTIDPFTEEEAAADAARDDERADALLLASALLAGIACLLVAARALGAVRRARRRRAAPEHSVVGAWLDALERLDATGTPPGRRTAGDLVEAVVSEHGAEVAGPLAALADRVAPVLYGAGEVGPGDAGFAWAEADAFRRAITRRVPPLRRVLLILDPRTSLRSFG